LTNFHLDETKEGFEKTRDNNSLPLLNSKKNLDHSMKSNLHNSQFHTNDSIKVNAKYGSLKSALDSLDLIPEYEEKDDDKINNNDLFKDKKKINLDEIEENEKIEQSLEEINKFNSMIIKNATWGSAVAAKGMGKVGGEKLPLKPSIKKMEQELGNS